MVSAPEVSSLNVFSRRSKVLSSLGFGRALSRQNLSPFQRSWSVPGGGWMVVQRLWYATWAVQKRFQKCPRGIPWNISIVASQRGSRGCAQ
jgi:hypothetical protein